MSKVDIVMGVYNCEKYLADSIESILKQSFKDWRLIICDDKSVDKTLEIAEEYAKKYPKKIIVLKNNRNMGLNYTLNKCLKETSAEYIARMDGDDISKPERLEKEIDFLEKHLEYAFVSTAAENFDEDGVWGRVHHPETPNKNDFTEVSPFCHASTVIRRAAIEEVGWYTVDKKLLRVEDYHLWFKLYEKGYKGYNIQEILYSVRDDKNADKRRTWKNRFNEFYCRRIGYRMLKIKWYKRLTMFRPLILGLIPKRIYRKMLKTYINSKENKK